MLGHWEILLIFLAILLLFGGKKIPEIAKGLGKGLREFKKAKDDITDSIEQEAEAEADPGKAKPEADVVKAEPDPGEYKKV